MNLRKIVTHTLSAIVFFLMLASGFVSIARADEPGPESAPVDAASNPGLSGDDAAVAGDAPVVPSAQAESSPGVSPAAEESFTLGGNFRLMYEGRYLTDDFGEDSRVFSTGDLRLEGRRWPHFRVVLAGDYRSDLDGRSEEELDRTATILNSFSGDRAGFLYTAVAELYELDWLKSFRLGRMYLSHELSGHMDGASFDLTFFSRRLSVFGYAGRPVDFFGDIESTESLVAGGGLDLRLPTGSRLTAEHQYCDEVIGGVVPTADSQTSRSQVSLRQYLEGQGYLGASLSLLDEEVSSYRFFTSLYFENIGLEVDGNYQRQDTTIETLPTFYSPLVAVLGPIKPHQAATLMLSKKIYADRVSIMGGYEWRQVSSDEEASAFNRSFQHLYVGVLLGTGRGDGLTLMLHADMWQDLEESVPEHIIGGGEIRYGSWQRMQLRAGGYYSLYKYDYYRDLDETTDVYTVFAEGRLTIARSYLLGGRYELEMYDIYEHTVQVSIGYQF